MNAQSKTDSRTPEEISNVAARYRKLRGVGLTRFRGPFDAIDPALEDAEYVRQYEEVYSEMRTHMYVAPSYNDEGEDWS